MIKKLRFFLYFVFPSLSLLACDSDDGIEFLPEPQTRIGNILFSQTKEVANLATDTTYNLSKGVEVTEIAYRSDKGNPVKIFLFEIDLSQKIWIETSMPFNDTIFRMQPMRLQAWYKNQVGKVVLGAVNGDYYNMDTGVPSGIFVMNGKILKDTYGDATRSFFAITKDGKALVADNPDFHKFKSSIQQGLGGSVRLLRDGNIVHHESTPDPRTAIGISQDKEKIFLLVVDGRNWPYSVGMDYENLALLLKELGANDAINLDGGGSSTFVVRNSRQNGNFFLDLRNIPSDKGNIERPVANGLVIIGSL